MQQPNRPSSPAGSERARFLGFLSKSDPTPAPTGDERTDAVMAAVEAIVTDRLQEGMRAIQRTADVLMHEIAGEVWRTAGGDKGQVQAKILESISRDQAIRSLIAHSDERFQDIAMRTARLEEAVTELTESTRLARDAIARGAETLHLAAGAPAVRGMAELQEQLEQVTRQMAVAFQTLAERDRLLVETIRDRVRENGEIVAQETGRVAEAVQAYVEQGVSAIGHLAGRIESQVETFASGDVDARLNAVVEEQMRLLGEQLQLLYDRVGVETSTLNQSLKRLSARTDERVGYLAEHLQLMHDRIGMESRDLVEEVQRTTRVAEEHLSRVLETRVMGLAQLVRSDSEALRAELVRTVAEQDESVARRLDESLGRVSEALTSATRWLVEELTRRVREESGRAIQGQLDEAVSTIDRNMVRMSDTLDAQLDRLGRTVGEQAAEATRRAVGDGIDTALGKMDEGIAGIGRIGRELARAQEDSQHAIARALDAKIAALAKMVRSDNQALAERVQIVAEQDAAKQALRAVKEMQATMSAEIAEIVDKRVRDIAEQLHHDVQATAESVARVGDLLDRKVEQVTTQMSERYETDIQNVVDRMGDAMHALANLGRTRPDRIELE